MAKETKTQKAIVERVMHEFKEGELESGGGAKVRNPKQAIAIALSEAGASDRRSAGENGKRLAATKRKTAAAGTAKAGGRKRKA